MSQPEDNIAKIKQEEPDLNEEKLEYESFSEGLDTDAQTASPEEAEPNEDKARITILEAELERTKELMMRTVAEAENGRKRAMKEREDASKFAVTNFSRDMLNVADNLRRALDAIPPELEEQNPQVKNLTDGINATERELLRSFEKNGIQKVTPMGERFDPNFHEVMFETPMPDKEAGTIIQVIENGYTLNGRILRPARVGISKSVAPESTGEAGSKIDTQV
ncbi:MAG: nucleotide exchange factor GrpE [Alphaproteobacteria bacterium]